MGVYRRTGVGDACLWLQDRHGVDVSFLLFLVWAGLARGPLEGERFERGLAFSREWSEHVVARLRAVRRWLKTGGDDRLGAEGRTACRSLRDQIADRELEAERLEQSVLAGLVVDLPAVRQQAAAARAAAGANVRRYLAALAIEPDDAIESRVSLILDAALA